MNIRSNINLRRIFMSNNANVYKSKKNGFTLIEVAISLLVFSIVVIIFASSVVMAKKAAHMNAQYAQALSICQHKIDQLRAVGFGRLNYQELNDAEIVDDSPSDLSGLSFTGQDRVADYLPQPTSSLAIDTPDSSDPKTLRATVSLTWHPVPYESRTSTVTLVALIVNTQ